MSLPESADYEGRSQKRPGDSSTIINLPMGAMIDDADPTRDIRSLIEDLHRTTRESRRHVQELTRDNELLNDRLETAMADAYAARQRESELSSRFVEITSLIKERDDALAAGERHARNGAELQARLEAVTREQESAHRQLESATRQLEAIRLSAETTAAQLAQARSQVLSIRLARDSTQAASREISDKLARAEDEIAELGYAKESAEQAARQSNDQLADARHHLQTMALDREALLQQVAELRREIDLHRQKILDLADQRSTAEAIDSAQAEALSEARQQITSISLERDAERNRTAEFARELESAHEQIEALRQEQADAQLPAAELEQVRRQLESALAEREAYVARENELLQEVTAQQVAVEEMAAQLAAAHVVRDESLAAVAGAEARIEKAIRERDEKTAASAEKLLLVEAELSAVQSLQTKLERTAVEARWDQIQEREKLAAMTQRCEEHRVMAIDLGTRLEVAKRELIEFTAKLAEARLQVKFANAKSAVNSQTENDRSVASALADGTDPLESEYVEGSEDMEVHEPLTDKDARSVLLAMRHCHQAFVKTPTDLSLINELYSHAHSFAERARISGLTAVYRLGTALAALARHSYEVPEGLNASTLRTIQQTIEFLTTLVRDRNLARLRDPAKAQVFAVEDDIEHCETIASGLEMVKLPTRYSPDPMAALTELANGHYDLIFLDVNLPGINGFELCSHIRQLPDYFKTPVVFLTGLDSLENRALSTERGGNDFIAKPFNLHELGVKALTIILKSQLD